MQNVSMQNFTTSKFSSTSTPRTFASRKKKPDVITLRGSSNIRQILSRSLNNGHEKKMAEVAETTSTSKAMITDVPLEILLDLGHTYSP